MNLVDSLVICQTLNVLGKCIVNLRGNIIYNVIELNVIYSFKFYSNS